MQLARNDSQRGTIQKRMLATIEDDYRKFVEDGQQKFFNYVIHEDLLDIDLDKYSIFFLSYNYIRFWWIHFSIAIKNAIKMLLFTGVCSWTSYQLGIFKKLFDKLEEQCFELDKMIHMKLVVQSGQLSEENSSEKILALRAAQQHRNQAKQFHKNANTLHELLNLQSLHSDVVIMRAYITAMQTEIAKLLDNAKQEVKEILTKSPYTNIIDTTIY